MPCLPVHTRYVHALNTRCSHIIFSFYSHVPFYVNLNHNFNIFIEQICTHFRCFQNVSSDRHEPHIVGSRWRFNAFIGWKFVILFWLDDRHRRIDATAHCISHALFCQFCVNFSIVFICSFLPLVVVLSFYYRSTHVGRFAEPFVCNALLLSNVLNMCISIKPHIDFEQHFRIVPSFLLQYLQIC